MSKKKPKYSSNEDDYMKSLERSVQVIKSVATIFKAVGMHGFFVVVFTTFIFAFASLEQKRAIIDTYILFKPGEYNYYPVIFVTILLILMFIVIIIYQSQMLKMRKRENNRIGEEKSKLQEKELNKKLKSSK